MDVLVTELSVAREAMAKRRVTGGSA